jgi:DNA-binding IclR family transcriptional regulator
MTTPNYRVPALEKGLDALELLARSDEPKNLTQLAEALGRSKQEIFRVVTHLTERGYFIRDASDGYRISTKMFELGSRHSSIHSLIVRALPHMERLTRELNEPCHLSIVTGDRMLVIARTDCEADVAMTIRIGASYPMHTRNTGKVALAYQSAERRNVYWKNTDESPSQIQKIEAQIKMIQIDGYLVDDSAVTSGVKDYIAPILIAADQLVAVISISHVVRYSEKTKPEAILCGIESTAKRIAQEFSPKEDNQAKEKVG